MFWSIGGIFKFEWPALLKVSSKVVLRWSCGIPLFQFESWNTTTIIAASFTDLLLRPGSREKSKAKWITNLTSIGESAFGSKIISTSLEHTSVLSTSIVYCECSSCSFLLSKSIWKEFQPGNHSTLNILYYLFSLSWAFQRNHKSTLPSLSCSMSNWRSKTVQR